MLQISARFFESIHEEAFDVKYELKARGYDFDRVVLRVAEVMGMRPDQVTAFGKSPRTVTARSLLCFWTHRKLGMSTVEIAVKLRIEQPEVIRSSIRGEQIAGENQLNLMSDNRIKAYSSPLSSPVSLSFYSVQRLRMDNYL